MTDPPSIVILRNGKYHVAFLDEDYKDYVIETSASFDTLLDARAAILTKQIYPDMPCKYGGK